MQTLPQPSIDQRQWPREVRRLAVQALLGARAFLRVSAVLAAELWRAGRPILRAGLQFLLALIIVFEEWGWRPLADLLGRATRWRPVARLEHAIARLPPYAALVVFVLPTTLLLPLKFLALFLVANGQVVLAGLLFMAAKVVATALIARLFVLTQPALMQIGWFARAYETFMPWKEALAERVHTSWAWRVGRLWKERFKRGASEEWRRWRPTLLPRLEHLRLRLRLVARQLHERWRAYRSPRGRDPD